MACVTRVDAPSKCNEKRKQKPGFFRKTRFLGLLARESSAKIRPSGPLAAPAVPPVPFVPVQERLPFYGVVPFGGKGADEVPGTYARYSQPRNGPAGGQSWMPDGPDKCLAPERGGGLDIFRVSGYD